MRRLFAALAALAASAAVVLLILAIVYAQSGTDHVNEECAISAELVVGVASAEPCGHLSGCACEEVSSLPAMEQGYDCEHEQEVATVAKCPHCTVGHSHRYSTVYYAAMELERSTVPRPTMKTPTIGAGHFDEHMLARHAIPNMAVLAVGVRS
jgi:hypothetical protein